MQLSWDDIQANAVKFSKRWDSTHREKAEAQPFVTEFLGVFGVVDPVKVGEREKIVKISGSHDKYIDFFWKGQIAIEMKSRGKDLGNAYQQLQFYMEKLPAEDVPDLWMVCDFETVQLWRRSTSERFTFKLKELRKHVRRFANIAGYTTQRIREDQVEVNVKAAEKMAKLHDALKDHGYDGHDLEVYLVRLLFCLFADDTGIFPQDSLFHYIEESKPDGSDLSDRITRLFEYLNMPEDIRAKRTLVAAELKQFRYINGGLFKDVLPSAEFNAKMRQTLLECVNFNWDKISPAIFGAMFQGVMDKTQRRELGAHYTSEENIVKLIDPLFMNNLWKEFDRVKTDPIALERFHDKISQLRFLDPACGCGNFLIITYRELRTLELEILRMKHSTMKFAQIGLEGIENPLENEIRVNVNQFYGIEYEDFPCQIAMVGMWLIDHQMNNRVSDEFGVRFVRLPLTHSATIVHGNALRIDWEDIIPRQKLSYILGNPPFVGGMMMSREQKSYMDFVFGNFKGVGELDYVSAWYKKATDYMMNANVRTAFVSTNSIAQGQQAVTLWEPLLNAGIIINFAYRTFVWNNEAKGKAAVHCVIIGFSFINIPDKFIFDGAEKREVKRINSYLVDAPIIFIDSRSKPLCNVPPMHFGSMPRDGGGFTLTDEEKDELISAEPLTEKWIFQYIGSYEFINNKSRWCLWLVDANPSEVKKCPIVMRRIESIREFRANSIAAGTRKFADTPMLFCQIAQPNTDYIAVPKVSSERRRYIPIGFLSATTIASDLLFLIPNATLYHFGVLTSNVHNGWMRAVCGRLKSDYRYAKDIVYNNFPWPETTDEQKSAIEKLAQIVLDMRSGSVETFV